MERRPNWFCVDKLGYERRKGDNVNRRTIGPGHFGLGGKKEARKTSRR